jgi:hypothetical protein
VWLAYRKYLLYLKTKMPASLDEKMALTATAEQHRTFAVPPKKATYLTLQHSMPGNHGSIGAPIET